MSLSLYQINVSLMDAFEHAIDRETGEIKNEEALDALEELQMQREEKIEGLLLWVKNLTAEAEAIKKEKATLETRQKALEKRANTLMGILAKELNGEKFDTPRVSVRWRKSESVEYKGDVYLLPEDCIKYLTPEINKTELKKKLKNGANIPGAEIVVRNNMQIK